MRTIATVSIWHNGTVYSADTFYMACISSDLVDSANFYYELRVGDVMVAQGNLGIDGTDYLDMNADSDSANFCFVWAATQLGLTIV